MKWLTGGVLVAVGVACAIGCSDLCVSGECSGSQEARVFLGRVVNLDSSEVLVEVCALHPEDGRARMRFHAPPGATVEEEVVLEGRREDFEGHDPVHGGEAFWCSDAPKPSPGLARSISSIHACLVGTDDDPPAKILNIDPRGLFPGPDLSTGYALTLEILHPGVLHIVMDSECRAAKLGQPIPDGGLRPRTPWAELEVL